MFRSLSLAAGLLTLVACGTAGPDVIVDGGSMFESDANVQGRLVGDMPVTGAFDQDFTQGMVFKSRGMVEFDLHATGGHGWAMLGGGFEKQNLEAGESVTLDEFDHWVFGCSGDSEWNAEFDEPAKEVTVSKDIVDIEGQEMIEVTVTATFFDGSDATAIIVRPTPEENPED